MDDDDSLIPGHYFNANGHDVFLLLAIYPHPATGRAVLVFLVDNKRRGLHIYVDDDSYAGDLELARFRPAPEGGDALA